MIDFKFDIASTARITASVLLEAKHGNIVACEGASIARKFGATVLGGNGTIFPDPRTVGISPRLVSGLFGQNVLLSPSFRSRSMAMRVFGAACAYSRGLVSRSGLQPFGASLNRTLHTDAIGYEFLVEMPVLAQRADREMTQSGFLGCDARRMPWLLGLMSKRVLDRACGTNSGGCVSFRKVPVTAWLSGIVETFSDRFRSLSLRYWFQGSTPPVSNIFIVARAA